jgi:hypothetical protein
MCTRQEYLAPMAEEGPPRFLEELGEGGPGSRDVQPAAERQGVLRQ